jgi:hypothetical protein
MQPQEVKRVDPAVVELLNHAPERVASVALQQFGGNQRAAETRCWAIAEEFPRHTDAYAHFKNAALAVVDGREDPPVERVTSSSPTTIVA